MTSKRTRQKRLAANGPWMERFRKRLCPNCGEHGPHFVPPSLGDKGFYFCGINKSGYGSGSEVAPDPLPTPLDPGPAL